MVYKGIVLEYTGFDIYTRAIISEDRVEFSPYPAYTFEHQKQILELGKWNGKWDFRIFNQQIEGNKLYLWVTEIKRSKNYEKEVNEFMRFLVNEPSIRLMGVFCNEFDLIKKYLEKSD